MKVHIVLNSHIDPAWQWDKGAGMDEVIATARTACDILDDYPEPVITRGEAWFYEVLERCALDIYERVKKHIATGRWQVVGNWYIQPDCNQPSAQSFLWQAELSKETFAKLGVAPSVGYNVDSFGHAATLPDFYRACGVDSYILRRPGAFERKLPGELFKWESPSGNAVTVARIMIYSTTGPTAYIERNIKGAIAAAYPGVGHALCMVGAGDHGGGPTRREIEYILEHRRWSDDVELVFSHPRAFFDAVGRSGVELPVVRDELQQHAIGCYTVMHRLKQQHRRAEELITQAETLIERYPQVAPADAAKKLVEMKKTLLFNEFHDLLGGCSIQRVMERSLAELGGVWSSAQNLVDGIIRRADHDADRPDPCQKEIFHNASKRDFKGVVEFSPWLGYYPFREMNPRLAMLDERGNSVVWQTLPGEPAHARPYSTVALPLEIPAGGKRVIRIKYDPAARELVNRADPETEKLVGEAVRPLKLRLDVLDDPTDTWSHDASRYVGRPKYSWHVGRGKFHAFSSGEIMHVALRKWECPAGRFELEARKYCDSPMLRFKLRVYWSGRNELVKLCLTPNFRIGGIYAGCPGGVVTRSADDRELPFYNFVSLVGGDEALTVISRDIYGCDVLRRGVLRLTLLRSSYYAHTGVYQKVVQCTVREPTMFPITDQGMQEFEFSVLRGGGFDADAVADEAARQTKPIHLAETTLGCDRRYVVPHGDR